MRLLRLSCEAEPITELDNATDALACLGWDTRDIKLELVDPADPRLKGRRMSSGGLGDPQLTAGVWEVELPAHIEARHVQAERWQVGYYQPSWTMSWGAAELVAWLVVEW